MAKKYKNIETTLIHGGVSIDECTGAVNVPIFLSSTFKQDVLGERRQGWEYARTGNPTRQALETLIADVDGGVAGFAFASGMAAISTAIELFESGDNILISSNVYGGTYRILDKVFSHLGITYTIVNTEDEEEFKKAIKEKTKAILIESPANPLLTITDIKKISQIAHKKGLKVIVDNTFMTPYLQRPLALGADIVVYSATKYMGGHSDVIAGLLVVNSEKLKERIAFLQNSVGAVLSPFDSFLLTRGIKTLSVRMDRHVNNAEKIAEYLQKNPAVKKLYYPGSESFSGYEVNKKQAKNGGVMLSFELKETYDYKKFFKRLKLITLAESLGGVESLVCHPASMTHASIPKEVREKIGITDGLIRLSTGIENAEDLILDIEAIKGAKRKR